MTSERECCHALNVLLLNIKAPRGKASPAAMQHLVRRCIPFGGHTSFQAVASSLVSNHLQRYRPAQEHQTSSAANRTTTNAKKRSHENPGRSKLVQHSFVQHESTQAVLNCTVACTHVTVSDQSEGASLPSRLRCAVNVKA